MTKAKAGVLPDFKLSVRTPDDPAQGWIFLRDGVPIESEDPEIPEPSSILGWFRRLLTGKAAVAAWAKQGRTPADDQA